MRPAPQKTAPNRAAFTLFEVCMAVFIGVMIMLAAVPSISGVIEEQRAKKLFNQFDGLVKDASSRAVTERRPYVLEWDDTGVTMHPLAPDLLLPTALVKDPLRLWTFWPTGTCEPATIICHVANAPWTATYDPLTEQPVFTSP